MWYCKLVITDNNKLSEFLVNCIAFAFAIINFKLEAVITIIKIIKIIIIMGLFH